jgi:hypothetical protein
LCFHENQFEMNNEIDVAWYALPSWKSRMGCPGKRPTGVIRTTRAISDPENTMEDVQWSLCSQGWTMGYRLSKRSGAHGRRKEWVMRMLYQ